MSDIAKVVDLPSPEQRERVAKEEQARQRICTLINAQADGWQKEVTDWLDSLRVVGEKDVVADHVYNPLKKVLEKYLTPGKRPEPVSTGFPDLDALVSLEPGSLVTIGARSGRGKSSISFQMAMHVAMQNNGASLYFSSEMPAEQLMLRGACLLASVDSKAVRRGNLTDAEQHAMLDAANRIHLSLAWMVDRSGLDIHHIRRIARRECHRIEREKGHRVRVIVVDYLQRIQAPKQTQHMNREQQVAQIAFELKEMAMELGVCVIAPAQLNADGDDRKNERPRSSDLRESKNIENESDIVLLIHNPSYTTRQSDPDHDHSIGEPCEIIVSKGRSDGNGTVPVWFTPMFTRFSSMTRIQREDWLRERNAPPRRK